MQRNASTVLGVFKGDTLRRLRDSAGGGNFKKIRLPRIRLAATINPRLPP